MRKFWVVVAILAACSTSGSKADDHGARVALDLGQPQLDLPQPQDVQAFEVQDLYQQGEVQEVSKPQDASTTPPGHTENVGGVWHKPGKEDALKNCTTCHGAKLDGGVRSCYDCHSANDHTQSHGGVKHKSGQATTCTTCHGPNNSGGLGPACSKCH